VERIGEFRMTGGGAAVAVALEVGKYSSGHTALYAVDAKSGEQLAKLSVDLPNEDLQDGQIYLRDYMANERITEYAIRLGFLEEVPNGLDITSGSHELRLYQIVG